VTFPLRGVVAPDLEEENARIILAITGKDVLVPRGVVAADPGCSGAS
jgi:hypothetical protein